MNPKISIVIPTLNEEKFISRTLDCFKSMTIAHEVIVSDGGSKDTTALIARNAGARVFVHDNSYRQTIAQGRNVGGMAATGDILVFLDADCVIADADQFFGKVIAHFNARQKAVAICPRLGVLPEYARGFDWPVTRMMNFSFWFFTNVLRVASAPGECQIMRRSTYNEIGGYNGKLIACEDIDIFGKLSKKGEVPFFGDLEVLHTCRRAHKTGWPKLLFTWFINSVFYKVRGQVYSKEWKPIR